MTSDHGPILIVDDDADIRESLGELLRHHGYQVVTAANGLEALDLLEDVDYTPCVILLDLMMPAMNGYEFRAAQKQEPTLEDVPVVVITAGSDVREDEVAPAEILRKPLDLPVLMESLARHC